MTVLGVPRGGIIVADIVAANDYNTFKNCLSNADSTKGYATKKEIRQCITQAYPPPLNSTSSPSTNTGVVTPTPAG